MKFKHSVPVQLRFNDADALGHVNNSVYFTFYDLGKTEYFKAVRGGEIPKEVDIVVATPQNKSQTNGVKQYQHLKELTFQKRVSKFVAKLVF